MGWKDNNTAETEKKDIENGGVGHYDVFPGIQIFYDSFPGNEEWMTSGLPRADKLKIVYCIGGGTGCVCCDGNHSCSEDGRIILQRWKPGQVSFGALSCPYRGICLLIDLEKASAGIKQLEQIMGNMNIDFQKILDKFCENNTCAMLRSNSTMERFFRAMYQIKPGKERYLLNPQICGLMMYLTDVEPEVCRESSRYFVKKQIQAIRQIHARMTMDLQKHYTLMELSEEFGIPITSMKTCFKEVYGRSIYSYMKTYRMRQAAFLLRETTDSVTEIASQMGYDNPSKFSEAFKKEFGELPSEYRKKTSK